ncbi:hypothetical protein A9Q99_26735 [Gammaproteobacteria bacterium 45_16_T64]|nr:hypothetical protein A9Q99_26735 [Gammaproteobacteria bacterium 45_16_T64]
MSDIDDQLVAFCQRGMADIRHSEVLGIKAVAASKQGVTLLLPYQPGIVGDIETGAMHGGVIFSLADQASGFAVFSHRYPKVQIAPTLDLRIDHMRKSTKDTDMLCFAECYRATDNVAFTRAVIHEGDIDNPVAHAVGSYMFLENVKDQRWLREGA